MEKLKHPEAPGQKNNIPGGHPDTLQVVYYTDPLCCWSWAFETVWQQFKTTYGSQLAIRYCMGGMLQQWQGYHDALLSVSRPAQMGPVWMQVNHTTGVPLDSTIWFRDPPASSYPACLAVKCAGRQSPAMEEQYLYLARKAVMTQQKNIARKEVLLELGQTLEAETKGAFNAVQFSKDLGNLAALEACSKDIREVKNRGISRFPSLLITAGHTRQSVMITGYRPIEELEKIMEKLMHGH